MTRIEFDRKVTELREEKKKALAPFIRLQSEIKEQIAAKGRLIHEAQTERLKLEQQRISISQQIDKIANEHSEKITQFIRDYQPSTTSNLAEANTLTMVWELRRRGFTGIIQNASGFYDLSKDDWNNDSEETAEKNGD